MRLLEETNTEMMEKIEQLIQSNETLQRKVEEQKKTITALCCEKQKLADSLQKQVNLVEKQSETLRKRQPTELEEENARLKEALKKSEQVVFHAEQRTRAVDERIEEVKLEYAIDLFSKQSEAGKKWERVIAEYKAELSQQRIEYEETITRLQERLQRPWYIRVLNWFKGVHIYETNY